MTATFKEVWDDKVHSLVADLKAARVEAGITCREAAKTIGIPVETFAEVEAGKVVLTLSDIRAYAYAVGAVVEYSVNSKKAS